MANATGVVNQRCKGFQEPVSKPPENSVTFSVTVTDVVAACEAHATSVPERPAPDPGRPGSRQSRPDEGSPEMTTLNLTARYARYLLTSLATVAFAFSTN
jgi:hypothetical protein